MAMLEWVREKYIYLVVLALLMLFGYVIWLYHAGDMGYEAARVYVAVLTGIATLALLYFAYFNITSRKEEDFSRLELAVRPIFVWELEAAGNGARMVYKTLKHPIYDFKATLRAGGRHLDLNERHLDVFESNSGTEKKRDVTDFIAGALGSAKARTVEIEFAYHSEAGGHYFLKFTKEVARKGKGYLFTHRKFVSAKYPWRREAVQFDNEG